MDKTLALAIIVTIIFSICKLLEMKYIEEEWKPLKILVKDSIIVFISSFIGIFIYIQGHNSFSDFFSILTDTKINDLKSTEVFTGEPEF
tara:strand:+ start:2596 stop:2862 length:267 start_codon:yes stop_codon:yes gene_type:complete